MTTLIQKTDVPVKAGIFNAILLLFLGSVFVFSGLIKLNDPVGTKIKLEEYFEVFAQDLPALSGFFESLVPLALTFSVILCVAEVVLGVAVLLRYRMKLTVWLLLGIIVFFTILTFYSAYFNKVTDCGCFGDAIKLKPWQSFGKDVLLLTIILYLLSQRSRLPALFPEKTGNLLTGLVTALCLALGLYAIFYLPPVDFLPYKTGKSIPEQMKLPPGAKTDIFETTYTLKNEKSGIIKVMTDKDYIATEIWKDSTWHILPEKTENRLVQEGEKPKIMGFAVTDSSHNDITEQLFKGNKLLVIVQNFPQANEKSLQTLNDFISQHKNTKGMETLLLTSSDEATALAFQKKYGLTLPLCFADGTVLKTMMRTNPGVMLLQNGTVRHKWSYLQLPGTKEIQENL